MILLTSGQHRGPMARELPYVAGKARAAPARAPRWPTTSRPRGITVNAVNPGPTDTGWAPEEIVAAVLTAASRGAAGARPTTPRG